jgi:FkbM family methyltransferase
MRQAKRCGYMAGGITACRCVETGTPENIHTEEVESITIDLAAELHLPARQHPALIKIDVEGSEVDAIKGARHLIDEGALVVMKTMAWKECIRPRVLSSHNRGFKCGT